MPAVSSPALVESPTPSARGSARSRLRAGVTAFLELAEARWAMTATGLFLLGVGCQVLGAPDWSWWALYLACYATGGWEPTLAGLRALRGGVLDVDVLMIVAALGAAAIGQVFDGALLIVIFATSGALEAFATRRTEDSVRALLDLTPERARRLRTDGSAGEVEEEVDVAVLVVGDRLVVRPGERIGADGRVLDGLTEVDQASITGEPLPVTKRVGDEVFAGTINGTGAITLGVTHGVEESLVARIVAQVAQASATKARTQLFIERVEQRYSVGVVVATIAVFVTPLLLGASTESSLLRAMTFMIVASPCAVVLATMPPLLAAMANASRHGVLIKSAVALEELGGVDLVVFDKTGTLTHGHPRVTRIVTASSSDVAEDALLRLAASAERLSAHPVARAIVDEAGRRGLPLAAAHDFTSTPGRGVTARVEGREVTVGSPAGTVGLPDAPDLMRTVAAAEAAGSTVVVACLDGRAVGAIALDDRVRREAASAVRSLRTLTGATPMLLTGDNHASAERLAAVVGIDHVEAGLLPEQKATAVERLQADGRRVLLVGDGVNDAPAMATARVGVAMGRTGSDLAMETSDVVLVRDDLEALTSAVTLARRAHSVVVANLVIAGSIIATLVTWDLVATLPLPLGVAGHEGSTILVALNGLRLLRRGEWDTTGMATPR